MFAQKFDMWEIIESDDVCVGIGVKLLMNDGLIAREGLLANSAWSRAQGLPR